jgi:hypothetical protein
LHSLFCQSNNTMAKSKDTLKKKLEKAVNKSTKAGKTLLSKVGGTPTKHSSQEKRGMPTKGNTKKTPSANENEMPTKHSSPQASGTPKNPYVPSPKNSKNGSPKNGNNGKKAKELHKILILHNADEMPFGWAFVGFYDIKEWLKSLCNRDGSLTSLGTKTFQPFTNLTIRWVLNLELADKIWVIYIDTTKSEINGSFPVSAHVLFANKIARAVLSSNVQWVPGTFEVMSHTLTESQEEDLSMQVAAKITPPSAAAVMEQELFLQQIAAYNDDLESLI